MNEIDVSMTPQEACRTVRSLRPELRRLGARQLWLFGSRARGQGAAASDWDFLVEFDRSPSFGDFMGLKLLLEDHLGSRVDLLSRQACTSRFLNAIRGDLVDVT